MLARQHLVVAAEAAPDVQHRLVPQVQPAHNGVHRRLAARREEPLAPDQLKQAEELGSVFPGCWLVRWRVHAATFVIRHSFSVTTCTGRAGTKSSAAQARVTRYELRIAPYAPYDLGISFLGSTNGLRATVASSSDHGARAVNRVPGWAYSIGT